MQKAGKAYKRYFGRDIDSDMFRIMLFKNYMRSLGGTRGIILYLLKDGPKSGSELMDGIERLSWGFWRPSPGTFYPALYKLIEEGLIRKNEDGRYELTQAGREKLGELSKYEMEFGISQALFLIESYVSYLEDVSRSQPEELKKHRERIASLAKRLEAVAG